MYEGGRAGGHAIRKSKQFYDFVRRHRCKLFGLSLAAFCASVLPRETLEAVPRAVASTVATTVKELLSEPEQVQHAQPGEETVVDIMF